MLRKKTRMKKILKVNQNHSKFLVESVKDRLHKVSQLLINLQQQSLMLKILHPLNHLEYNQLAQFKNKANKSKELEKLVKKCSES